MAYHHTSRQAKGGLGTTVLFMLAALAGGGFLAATMDDGSSSARIYLAEDLSTPAVAAPNAALR
ncbi:hypothetical protein [Pseudorhizobium pelagicum]|uniref:Uncharacterized protein n=1 Tax=Pseudorhizobium pelagicum TaxID=1509405 RepID=A0A922NZ55_9HYPH|nr:hypothetical protein [Pseudorhizobium pelagicum]KEQ03777.1 hypothetical protein GV68_16280 [Pseudorhizobium pelagicum]KEQ05532.1 hypothetical protein GV67_05290 [Pseudorhizobium pelagicum]MDY6960658.1 hypothetical protein [Pseudomonadota bacterium]